MNFNSNEFRECLGCYATGVTVITTKNSDLSMRGVTINSFSSVSLEPPLILFSLSKESHSYDNFIKSQHFTVNVLGKEQVEISKRFAHPSDVDWKNIPHNIGDNECPIIEGSIAYLQCKKEFVYEGGDHSIFVGKVLSLKKLSDDKPLLYYKGEYNEIKI